LFIDTEIVVKLLMVNCISRSCYLKWEILVLIVPGFWYLWLSVSSQWLLMQLTTWRKIIRW